MKHQYLQKPITELNSKLTENFQDGCNSIVNKLTELGVTPASNSPSDIITAIQTLKNTTYGKYRVTVNIIACATKCGGDSTLQVIFDIINGSYTNLRTPYNDVGHGDTDGTFYIYARLSSIVIQKI